MFHFKPSFPPLPASAASLATSGASIPSLLVASQEKAHQPLLLPAPIISPIKRHQDTDSDCIVHTPAGSDLNASFCSDNGQQDDDPVLKEMKLKGEFPCRLCPAVFPNLRALKGHNKEHMILAPFECNVGTCHYNTGDKTALLQHMRGHTGQKPFECKICNFGFTTKANCERHVRNKHNKNSKEDVRDHIIIHEGEDESYSGKHDNSYETEMMSSAAATIFPPTPPRSSVFNPFRPFDTDNKDDDIKEESAETDEAPLDLSKPTEKIVKPQSSAATDLKTDAKDSINNNHPYLDGLTQKTDLMSRFPFTLPFLPGSPAAPLWPPNLGLNNINSPPSAPTFPFNPMHLAALLAAKNEEIKKNMERMEAFQAKESPASAALHNLNQMQDLQRGFLGQISPTNSSLSALSPQASPVKSGHFGSSDTESNYKMVIKNGILMRKQKQRRYRTERPYGCDQCSARFTLRSNMDRHMKQQHPHSYSQRPRTGPGRKPTFHTTDDDVSSSVDHTKEEELIRKEHEEQKDGFESEEEEEGFLDEEDEEQSLIIDDNEHNNFNTIAQFFGKNDADMDGEAGSESSNGDNDDKKKSAYSSAPHKMPCPYCDRKFPWSSSLKRHILTHTGQKPYKCTDCPLWFTTKSNCDRHILRKHGNNNNIDDKDFDEDGMSGVEDEEHGYIDSDHKDFPARRDSTSEHPFKCHLCDEGFTERSMAIDHLETEHAEEYQSLLEKGAFDAPEEVSPQPNESGEELFDSIRGKFPDYVNRKIICLFCNRKFWSAEDLRRHVRTHTGERPYSCDICNRRFTLKHSMLRHKKKHDSGVSSNETSDDDSICNHSSSGSDHTRSETSPSHQQCHPQSDMRQAEQASHYDQKRANLMEKISRLNCAPGTDGQ